MKKQKLAESVRGEMKTEDTGYHSHEGFQILIVREGLMIFDDSNKRYILSGQNAAFIPQNYRHRGKTMSQGKWVSFSSLYFQGSSFEIETGISLKQLPDEIIVFEISELFVQCLEKLCECSEPKAEPYKTTLRLFYLLFLEEQKKRTPIVLPRTPNKQLSKTLDFIEEHYKEGVSLEQLEKEVHMSRRSIQRLFCRECQMTLSEYLRLRRIFQATIILSTTDESILSIALEVGYESLSAFYSAFSQLTGQTPSHYRAASL